MQSIINKLIFAIVDCINLDVKLLWSTCEELLQVSSSRGTKGSVVEVNIKVYANVLISQYILYDIEHDVQ